MRQCQVETDSSYSFFVQMVTPYSLWDAVRRPFVTIPSMRDVAIMPVPMKPIVDIVDVL
jgi:hypothetical protein